ncbi:MAG TPA: hypothetical protein VGL56_09475 [Fimbriimonadaceae bacterium]|jgi:hypothetical protein
MRLSIKGAKRLPKKIAHALQSEILAPLPLRNLSERIGVSNDRGLPYSRGVVIGHGAWQYIERYPEMDVQPRDREMSNVECRMSNDGGARTTQLASHDQISEIENRKSKIENSPVSPFDIRHSTFDDSEAA